MRPQTGETKTEAVTQAPRERLQRVRRVCARRRLADELDEIALHCSALPVRDPRTTDEIMGYDENGASALMVLNTSAIPAILQDEPERRKFNEAIEAAETRSLSAASFVECSTILESRYGADGVRDLDLFIAKAQVSLIPVDEEQG